MKSIINFKDFLNEAGLKDMPYSEKIYRAIVKGFERYYKANYNKFKEFRINDPAKFIDNEVSSNENYFLDHEKELIDFYHVCGKYITMAWRCVNYVGKSEADGEFKTEAEVWKEFELSNAHTDGWHLRKSQTKEIIDNIKKDLKNL